jgi:hypothetical protein
MKLLLFSLLALPVAALAQTAPATPAPAGQQLNSAALPLFRATLPGGTYEVAVRAIVAVSSHSYIVDGVARVTEVNIDTTGSLLARFYYLEPMQPNSPIGIGTGALDKAQEILKQAAERTGQDAWKKVVKNYPTSTHARTVEYRLDNKEDLDKVFSAAEEAFRLQKQKAVSVGG